MRLLQELYALYRSRANPTTYYSYRAEKTIDLTTFGSRQLWSMLDEAATIGMQTVHARKGLGAVERYGHAELCLDVTGGQRPGSLAITPVLRFEGMGVDGTDTATAWCTCPRRRPGAAPPPETGASGWRG